jgi:hypothetical protein
MSRELVPVKDDGCPECGGMLVRRTIWQAALFRRGGYGATRRTTVAVCFECRYSHVGEVTEVNPRTVPA